MAESSSHTNFAKAVANLKRSISTPITEPRDLSGILKDFEMSYELSWKVLKKHLASEGHVTQGAKDVYTKAFQLGMIDSESVWLEMIEDRNQTAHVYDENGAKAICERIKAKYFSLFERLLKTVTHK